MQKKTMISGTDLSHIENNALKIFQNNKNQIHSTSPEDGNFFQIHKNNVGKSDWLEFLCLGCEI